MTTQIQTRGQLERTLSQRIQAFYREQLGHQPSKITCQISDRNLLIVLENSITPAEKLLAESGSQELAEQVRSELDEAIQPLLLKLIEETLSVTVLELLSDATVETGRTGIIAVLGDLPNFRSPTATNKHKKKEINQDESQN
ncbi:DUF2294 domain-containing protein [Calothrix sp. PCC 6303]|uniref:DUF2294 domain-containing protein n=1 Tax=Calothrix sp. PCC 6303 TaxID=1170562 RepID=UPI0002A00FDF|nr:DUF2294 domain-containing protein [Calothrix sp. PCC 6303]AFZ01115.1 Protein of unknown function DUF2294 [Calothrix sp. PCC 6303]